MQLLFLRAGSARKRGLNLAELGHEGPDAAAAAQQDDHLIVPGRMRKRAKVVGPKAGKVRAMPPSCYGQEKAFNRGVASICPGMSGLEQMICAQDAV